MECDEECPQDSSIRTTLQCQLESAGENCGEEMGPVADALNEETINMPTEFTITSETTIEDEPKVGMIFDSEKDAYDFYSEYGRKVGFCIRWDTRTRSRITGETISRRFLCNKQGFRVDRQKGGDLLAKYHREETRCGCKAFMRIKLGNDGKFHVSELYNAHNHELVIPQKVTESKIEKKVVAPTSEFDYRNFLKTSGMNPFQKHETGCLLDFFMGKQSEDPFFFHSIQMDDDERITNVFWADGKMRVDFSRFGDVLCFDATYKSGDFARPLALFLGVNHHFQLILFGAAMLCYEMSDSLKWAFEAFVEAMSGKIPSTIFSDGSKEIVDAVDQFFPDSNHRFSAWLLYQDALKNLTPSLSAFPGFDDDLRKCFFDGEVETDFLKYWAEMLEKYGLPENGWLQERFEEREKWAAPYGRNIFSADMNNAWRFDSLSNDLGTYLNSDKDILLFLGNFDKLVAFRRNREIEANSKMTQSLPYAPPIAILQHAARVYTPSVFKTFMAEYNINLECFVKNRHFDGSIYVLTVEDSRHHEYLVTVNISQEILTCTCNKFESVGILCGHIMNCIIHDLRYIPDMYILKRWTRVAGIIPEEDPKSSSLHRNYNQLSLDFILLSLRAAEDEDVHRCAMKHKVAMYEEMERILKEKTSSVRVISSGSMFGGSQARSNAVGESFMLLDGKQSL